MMEQKPPVSILFVCMGNICRSPTAEAVMRHLIRQRGLEGQVIVDSAGTIRYHEGHRSDRRTIEAGSRRGYALVHRARQVSTRDYSEFDYIVGMDLVNMRDLKPFAPLKSARASVSLLLDHWGEATTREVPDPYYGGEEGFETVLDLVEKGCEALLEKIVREHGLRADGGSQP